MSRVREAVEWGFGEVVRQFAFLDFHKNQKVLLQPVGIYYVVGILLCNAHVTLHGSQVSQYFACQPPTLFEYFHGTADECMGARDDSDEFDDLASLIPGIDPKLFEEIDVDGEEENNDNVM